MTPAKVAHIDCRHLTWQKFLKVHPEIKCSRGAFQQRKAWQLKYPELVPIADKIDSQSSLCTVYDDSTGLETVNTRQSNQIVQDNQEQPVARLNECVARSNNSANNIDDWKKDSGAVTEQNPFQLIEKDALQDEHTQNTRKTHAESTQITEVKKVDQRKIRIPIEIQQELIDLSIKSLRKAIPTQWQAGMTTLERLIPGQFAKRVEQATGEGIQGIKLIITDDPNGTRKTVVEALNVSRNR